MRTKGTKEQREQARLVLARMHELLKRPKGWVKWTMEAPRSEEAKRRFALMSTDYYKWRRLTDEAPLGADDLGFCLIGARNYACRELGVVGDKFEPVRIIINNALANCAPEITSVRGLDVGDTPAMNFNDDKKTKKKQVVAAVECARDKV